jgi:DNA polymerase-3 subunit chi
MPEVWFYHLVRQPLEQVLPILLEKATGQRKRLVVQVATPERMDALDELLWTWSEESFIPHGGPRDDDPATQWVYLTTGDENPNSASMRIFADGANVADAALAGADQYERLILMFDGGDEDALAEARAQWKTLKAAGYPLSYWQQNENGGWEKKA